MSIAIAHVYDKLDVALLAHAKDPQARWIAAQMEAHPEDALLISVSTASATLFVGAASYQEAVDVLQEAKGELEVEEIELRGREDAVAPLRMLLAQGPRHP
jgi:hypothetical protein